jgi:hypothetical protein
VNEYIRFQFSSNHNTLQANGAFAERILLLIYIPVEDISSNGSLSNPNSVIVIPFIVCRALLISEVIVTWANVITEAKPNVIVKNKRTMFFIDSFFDQKVCILIDDKVKLFL